MNKEKKLKAIYESERLKAIYEQKLETSLFVERFYEQALKKRHAAFVAWRESTRKANLNK